MCGQYLEEDNIKITTSVHAYMPTLIVPKVVGGGGSGYFLLNRCKMVHS